MSKGVRLVIPDVRVDSVQGFIHEDKTLGIWCLDKDGKVLSCFNPSDITQPFGNIHKLRENEVIIGVCVSQHGTVEEGKE